MLRNSPWPITAYRARTATRRRSVATRKQADGHTRPEEYRIAWWISLVGYGLIVVCVADSHQWNPPPPAPKEEKRECKEPLCQHEKPATLDERSRAAGDRCQRRLDSAHALQASGPDSGGGESGSDAPPQTAATLNDGEREVAPDEASRSKITANDEREWTQALQLDGVQQSVSLRGRTIHRLILRNCEVLGDIDLTGATVKNGIEISGSVIRGALLLRHAEVRGDILIDDTAIIGTNRAVEATGLDLHGDLVIFRNSDLFGEIRLHGSTIEGSVTLLGTTIIGSESTPLSDRLVSDHPSPAHLRKGSHSVDFNFAKVTGLLLVNDSFFENSLRFVGAEIYQAEIAHSILLGSTMEDSCLYAVGIRSRYFHVRHCWARNWLSFDESNLDSLLLTKTRAVGTLGLGMAYSEIGQFRDDSVTIDSVHRTRLGGARYKRLHSESPRSLTTRINAWIEKDACDRASPCTKDRCQLGESGEPSHFDSAYSQLAEVYRGEGKRDLEAWTRYRLQSKNPSAFPRPVAACFDYLLGYGHLPFRALLYFAGFWYCTTLFVIWVKRTGRFVLQTETSIRRKGKLSHGSTWSNGIIVSLGSAIHAIDILVPFTKLRYEDRWRYDFVNNDPRGAALVHGLLGFVGWFIAVFLIAALTGLLG